MNKHFNEAVEGDDGGLVICRGCKSRGTYTELPGGECPTPYKPDSVLLAESLAREQALQLRLNAADQRIDELEELLTEAQRSVDYHAGMQREGENERLYGVLSRIRSALKPTESGASE